MYYYIIIKIALYQKKYSADYSHNNLNIHILITNLFQN